jgi:hypothetical protein
MANKWLKELRAYDDAVDYEYDSFAPENCLYTPSPYFNWIFANKSHGCPKNASILYFSEPKAGKSLSIYAQVLDVQRRDKEAGLGPDQRRHCIIFNTELRGQLQHDVFPEIDKDYMTIYDTNEPIEIFDRIEKEIKPMVQDGMPLAILAIDSLTNIIGVKRNDADSVSDHLVGDHALTVSIGLMKLVPFCKRNKIQLIATSQMRGNVDAANKYAPKEKMAESWAAKHGFEYFISLKKAGAAEDKMDIEGKTFQEEDMIDARGNALVTGHKIYVKMEMSSIGQSGRSAVFFMDYNKGIINQHEEIFFLAKNTGVIELEGRTYKFGDQKWVGKKECALAIRDNPQLAEAILTAVRKLDERK